MKDILKGTAIVISLSLMFFFSPGVLFTQEKQEIKLPQLPTSQDTTRQEIYVSEVLISAPWAKKNSVHDGEESPPGEFGLQAFIFPEDSLKEELPAPPLPEGPTAFTIAPNGDIYITDPLNERIQRFDENGSFVSVIPIPHFEGSKYVNSYAQEWSLICADLNHNVYLLWWEDYTEQYLCKYDPAGKLLNTYPFFPEVRIGGAGNELYCDSSDRLFFQYDRRLTDKIILSLKEWDLLRGSSAGFTFEIGTGDRMFTPEEQKSTLRRGPIKSSDLNKVALKAALESWRLPGEGLAVENVWNTSFVNNKGNFYRYWSTKEGIIITKWYKE